jgi:hypothetical protein
MKLYATVSSERASKGQGGNEYIDFKLKAGSTNDSRDVMTFRARLEGDEIVIGFWRYPNGETEFWHLPFPEPKGKQQKGEGMYEVPPHIVHD